MSTSIIRGSGHTRPAKLLDFHLPLGKLISHHVELGDDIRKSVERLIALLLEN